MKLVKIPNKIFLDSLNSFVENEKRKDFFKLAADLVKENKHIEAYIIILSTWNFASFRYFVKFFDLDSFKETLNSIEDDFISLENANIVDENFNQYEKKIRKIYNVLSAIKGVQFTGATKVMHLRNPNLFIIWDDYIRGNKAQKNYKQIDVFKKNYVPFKKYTTNDDGYIDFLNDMRNRFLSFNNVVAGRTLAKAIDEFNYVNITMVYQNMFEKKK